jgi:hypothetical protein
MSKSDGTEAVPVRDTAITVWTDASKSVGTGAMTVREVAITVWTAARPSQMALVL